ncbi:putative P-loop containing nucleoside triphosphate hydrolase, DNA2/NAM7 helicase, helicase [Helianthus annuus]|nr:putative P-loop containing nucleoside triphosphate hydrolase, DNA2/NAM7 helicase, helicase [Helianthus annuus]KAJ0718617.1 putative P-loop containing nucleoside triphosphate hydrolase, DNA2/NAM7 helicase, helicase [Helianthus annuus]
MRTTSHSYNLHNLQNEPFQFLVIDEATQLKEAESTIPLKLPGIMHVVLVGDECQLSAMVTSVVSLCFVSILILLLPGYAVFNNGPVVFGQMSAKWEFGRSLFGRLSLLGHLKKLLTNQYRMHPSISLFLNHEFYYNQIMDAEYVKSESYEKSYLEGEMFGSYSFIDVADGREEKDDDRRSRTNMVEVAVVVTIVKMLHQGVFVDIILHLHPYHMFLLYIIYIIC